MSVVMASLWEALGCPPLAATLPGARSSAWSAAREMLAAQLREHDVTTRIRSAGVLWRLLAGTAPGPGATWGQLCRLGTVEVLAHRVRATGTSQDFRIVSWNVRWLLSPHTERAAAKRAVIVRALGGGSVVMPQETHWTPAATAQRGGGCSVLLR